MNVVLSSSRLARVNISYFFREVVPDGYHGDARRLWQYEQRINLFVLFSRFTCLEELAFNSVNCKSNLRLYLYIVIPHLGYFICSQRERKVAQTVIFGLIDLLTSKGLLRNLEAERGVVTNRGNRLKRELSFYKKNRQPDKISYNTVLCI